MNINKPRITNEEAAAIVSEKTAPKVTIPAIEAKIDCVEYLVHNELLTICIITMKNGFMVVGHAAPASPENYDYEVGERISYDNAFKQLWPLEGYLLREKLFNDMMLKGV